LKNEKLELKKYLSVIPFKDGVKVDNLPPVGRLIEDSPSYLNDFFRYISTPHNGVNGTSIRKVAVGRRIS
jgi:hypothetical protein